MPVGSKALETLHVYLDKARPSLVGVRDEPHVFLNLRGPRRSPGRGSTRSSSAMRAPPAWLEHAHTRSGTRSPRICWPVAVTCARCRRCSATPTSGPRRSTRTSLPSGCARSTSTRIRVLRSMPMPELPEVETIRRQLAPHLEGRALVRVEIRDHRWTLPVPPEAVAAALSGATVTHLGRRGKYMIWELDDGRQLLVHLRMTGALLLDPDPEPAHTNVRIELDDGHVVAYVDPRRFGTGLLLRSAAERDEYLDARPRRRAVHAGVHGRVPSHPGRGRTAPVKSFILDQRRIAGVGNIYADEALHRAGIHPLRPGRLAAPAQWVALKEAIELALADGIDAKGASIDDFRHVDGARGSFQDRFPRAHACGPAVPGLRHHDPQAGGRWSRHLRLRALPAGAAGSPLRLSLAPARPGAESAQAAASSSCRRPPRSAAWSWSKPAERLAVDHDLGKVNMPVIDSSLLRPSGSRARLISSYGCRAWRAAPWRHGSTGRRRWCT